MERISAAFSAFYRANTEWFYLGLVIAFGAALADLSIQKAEVGALVGEAKQDHAASCVRSRVRLQTIVNFWSDTSTHLTSHAVHERDASSRWSTIVKDLDRDRVGSVQLRADVARVSDKWTELAGDDDANAARTLVFISELRADYDQTCGDVPPTPQPPAARLAVGVPL